MRYICNTPTPAASAPFSPPEAVRNELPVWNGCSPDVWIQCSDHHHDPSLLHQHDLHNPGDNSFLNYEWTCHLCGGSLPISSMHPLPCGHALCRPCLEEVVLVHVRGALTLQGDAVLAAATQSSKWQDHAAALEESRDFGGSRRAQDVADAARLWAQSLAGLTCCGQDAELEQWMECMRPRTAKILWTVAEALEPLRASRCGWKDCGELISRRCGWMQSSLDATVNFRWHCVRCGGNSQADLDHGARKGYLVPAR